MTIRPLVCRVDPEVLQWHGTLELLERRNSEQTLCQPAGEIIERTALAGAALTCWWAPRAHWHSQSQQRVVARPLSAVWHVCNELSSLYIHHTAEAGVAALLSPQFCISQCFSVSESAWLRKVSKWQNTVCFLLLHKNIFFLSRNTKNVSSCHPIVMLLLHCALKGNSKRKH